MPGQRFQSRIMDAQFTQMRDSIEQIIQIPAAHPHPLADQPQNRVGSGTAAILRMGTVHGKGQRLHRAAGQVKTDAPGHIDTGDQFPRPEI